MKSVKILSILLMVIGAALLGIGLAIYWYNIVIPGWANAFIVLAFIFLLSSIIILCLSQQYE